MVLLLVFMQLTRDLFAIAKFLLYRLYPLSSQNGGAASDCDRYLSMLTSNFCYPLKFWPPQSAYSDYVPDFNI